MASPVMDVTGMVSYYRHPHNRLAGGTPSSRAPEHISEGLVSLLSSTALASR
ncbi:hypothetical protein AB4097_09260 [Microvirga sp. 2MCAF35]|uniref:hypothetical protein n=1 Tax=Microvirga sp. 2MCAF35 TaxID=3232987 RepID=UPI003F9C3CF6